MFSNNYITLQEFSDACGQEVTIIREFADFGLIQIHISQNQEYLSADDISHTRRLLRLYHDLGINKEGIEIIISMRERMIELSQELASLRRKFEHLEHEKQMRLMDIPSRNGLIIDLDDL